ncbi:MAG: MnhB domain-containing protein [Actinomycetota bacterium]
MRRLLILDVSMRVLYPSIIVLSIYFLFSGHNQPGGGFVGGLTAAAGVALRYVAGGASVVRSGFRLPPSVILGLGLAVSVGTAVFPLLLGESVLEHATFTADPPLLGEVKATSALPFDIGVYLIVIGLSLMIFAAFGDDVDDELGQVEPPQAPARSVGDEYRALDLAAMRHEGAWFQLPDENGLDDDGSRDDGGDHAASEANGSVSS